VNLPGDLYALRRGAGPLLISAPHVGLELPADIAAALSARGRELVDTDWEADRLYPFADAFGATVLGARWSRYVVDLNRDPSGASLYPGARTTGLCATETFDGEPLYETGREPGPAEIAARRARYFDPYHAALRDELARLAALHGYVVLLDAHSIRSPLPLLFDGELPDVNVGTNSGRSCNAPLIEAVVSAVAPSPYSVVVDGRFKGGYITRTYGDPGRGVQAIQLEINQNAYLAPGAPPRWDDAKAARLSAVLRVASEALVRAAATAPARL
jgi:N-formylglutamate amidohydrolase